MTIDSQRDLARFGIELGEREGELFKTTLRAIASPQSGPVGSDDCRDFAAAQVLDAAGDATAEQAHEYVDAFVALYDLETMDDVGDLLGREHYEQRGYEGQHAFAAEGK